MLTMDCWKIRFFLGNEDKSKDLSPRCFKSRDRSDFKNGVKRSPVIACTSLGDTDQLTCTIKWASRSNYTPSSIHLHTKRRVGITGKYVLRPWKKSGLWSILPNKDNLVITLNYTDVDQWSSPANKQDQYSQQICYVLPGAQQEVWGRRRRQTKKRMNIQTERSI